MSRDCSVAGCTRKYQGKGYCNLHYQRWLRNGDPEKAVLRPPITPELFWQRTAITADDSRCWEWQGAKDMRGYGIVSIKHKPMKAHRYALHITTGLQPDACVMHLCDNPGCVNPKHLRHGTMRDNFADMFAKGRNVRGTRCSAAKLNEDAVRAIRSDSRSQRVLAQVYGVSKPVIAGIKNGTAWKHVV